MAHRSRFGRPGREQHLPFSRTSLLPEEWEAFLSGCLITCYQTLTDHQTGIPIRMASHTASRTEHQWRTRGIAFDGLPRCIASDKGRATSTFSTGISGIDTGRDDPFIPRLVFGVGEDTSLHPESAFAIASAAILALLGFEFA